MKQFIISAAAVLACTVAAADSGLVKVKSNHDVKTTADNLENALNSKGMKVFARIDHEQGAMNVDMALRPTQVIIFGNPMVGTPLMQCQQTVAIDLPQKALIYENDQGQTWLVYNDPAFLNQRHNLEGCGEALEKVSGALSNFAKSATE